ncbi:hypothetical protein R3W88_033990 [Solanum pinnatisectum]|uniref:Transcription factor CBF/NF-Y/archaeal histone domain-containing protein n=1 Tax=Solanum pinnatisectum TaxID=50273 RepID=A0AAV9JZE4_9SOLN|nr:hypothetical protein R3W88_033990 [Solanum pinnatisectum]
MENANDFKNNLLLPPTRIKKIMKKDEDVRMVAAEAPILLAKACELFIQDLTLRCREDDLTDVIMQSDNFDFLLDVVHGDDATDPFTLSFVPFYAAGGNNGKDGNNLDH